MGGGGKGGGSEAKQARADEQERQNKIRGGTARVGQVFGSQFTPDFFNKQRDSFTSYANPQLDQQHVDAQKELTYALARSGNMESSSRADLSSELERIHGLNRQKIADDALSYSNKARSGVEDARGNLIAMLNATGDAEGAAQDAVRRASVLSQPAAMSPLANLFADFTSGIGANAAAERAYQLSGGAVGRRGSGLFGARRGSTSVTY